jgi:hypothetical protein
MTQERRMTQVEKKTLEIAIAKSRYSPQLGCMSGSFTPNEIVSLWNNGARENDGTTHPTVDRAKEAIRNGESTQMPFRFKATGGLKEKMGGPKQTSHGRTTRL